MSIRAKRAKKIFRKLMIGALVAITIPLTLAGCRSDEMTAEEATEIATDRLDLTEAQSTQFRSVADNLFAEKDNFKALHKAVDDEILAQMKSDQADAAKLEQVASNSLSKLREKMPLLATSFVELHATFTSEQRSEIIEKMEKRKKRGKKWGWGRKSRREMTVEKATEIAADKLDLDDNQTVQLQAVVEPLFAEKSLATEHRKALSEEFLTQMKSDQADAAKLLAVANKALDQFSAKLPLLTSSFAQFHGILNAEQRAEIVEEMEERRERMENGRWGHWHGRWGHWH